MRSAKTYWLRPIRIWHNQPMADPETARAYLRRALDKNQISMRDASEALGLNHAYFQQYIVTGKPIWLKEEIRKGLIQAYPFIEEDRLVPPPRRLQRIDRSERRSSDLDQESYVHPEGYGKFIDDPRKLELLRIWDMILPDDREIGMDVLRSLARKASARVA